MIGSKERRALRIDSQSYDEVIIKTIPRYKESHLSGDEWRFCSFVQFKYKGFVVYERLFRDCETAMQMAYTDFVFKSEVGETNYPKDEFEQLCDQEGCSEKATIKAYVKQQYCIGGGNCGSKLDHNSLIGRTYRLFCDRHKTRGDCDLEDCDANYEKVDLPKHI